MLNEQIAQCCKELKLSKNILDMSSKIIADTYPEYLAKLLMSEIEHRESARKDKFLKNADPEGLKRVLVSSD